eukprot:TRINITY_DN11021_c0_g1_i1.p1 TRINITY_DN11021_c0_g1~~TRINITY_DN11021_c0_g1_i1.p1  ORF type:complete len:449 (+),score=172.38 TRINITY_DN11021_c0_g1_i1:78-1424(+)
MRVAAAALVLLCSTTPAVASFCHWKNGSDPVPSGPQNLYAINEFASSQVLVATVPNGKLFNVTVPHDGGATVSHFPVVHVYGDAKQRGAALGALFKTHLDVGSTVDRIWEYFMSQVTGALPGFVPKWLGDLIAEVGLKAALGLTSDLTKAYTTPEYYEEMEALAEAAGIDYVKLRDMNMIAGLTQGKCSMFGAWGDAIADKDGLLQLRALDWDMSPPIVDNPILVVYHTPNSTYVTAGVVGLVGALTGVSDKQMGISEIGVSFPDDTFGKQSRIGVPFIFLLRDILHKDRTLENAIERMQTAKRTCDLILGVGDGKKGAGGGKGFRGFQYSSSVCNVIDDTNLAPKADWHAPIDNIVYWGMDWICPGDTQALQNQLRKHYGKLTAEIAIRDVTAVETSGDTHLAYYDLHNMGMWVSFARQSYLSGPNSAYARQFTHIDLKKLFAEPRP